MSLNSIIYSNKIQIELTQSDYKVIKDNKFKEPLAQDYLEIYKNINATKGPLHEEDDDKDILEGAEEVIKEAEGLINTDGDTTGTKDSFNGENDYVEHQADGRAMNDRNDKDKAIKDEI